MGMDRRGKVRGCRWGRKQSVRELAICVSQGEIRENIENVYINANVKHGGSNFVLCFKELLFLKCLLLYNLHRFMYMSQNEGFRVQIRLYTAGLPYTD